MYLQKHIFAILVFALLFLGSTPVNSADNNEVKYFYDILKDGHKIGVYNFIVTENGTEKTIHAGMKIKVKVFFVTAYKASHSRTEIYKNDKLISIDGSSIYNGKDYKISYAPDRTLVTNGNKMLLEKRGVTVSPFIQNDDDEAFIITEKGKAKLATFKKVGEEIIKVSGKKTTALHYKVTGSVERDLWYDKNGILLTLSYLKDGSVISFRRHSL